MPSNTAAILTNLGTPESLDKPSVKRFLKQFLSDTRVAEIPRPVWWFILNGIISPIRSGKTLEAYGRMWGEDGSPLLTYSIKQQQALQSFLGEELNYIPALNDDPAHIEMMRELVKPYLAVDNS